MDEDKCRPAICCILVGRKVWELKRHLRQSGTREPLGQHLGLVDLERSPDCIDCVFRFQVGNTSYCDNQEVLFRMRLDELKFPSKHPT